MMQNFQRISTKTFVWKSFLNNSELKLKCSTLEILSSAKISLADSSVGLVIPTVAQIKETF